jgi:hypothetical protein
VRVAVSRLLGGLALHAADLFRGPSSSSSPNPINLLQLAYRVVLPPQLENGDVVDLSDTWVDRSYPGSILGTVAFTKVGLFLRCIVRYSTEKEKLGASRIGLGPLTALTKQIKNCTNLTGHPPARQRGWSWQPG